MSELSGISPLLMTVQESLRVALDSVAGILGTRPASNVEVPLKDTPGIDPHFIPRVPMKADNIDVHLLSELGKMGLKRGKEITAETHPDFYKEWLRISGNAKLTPPPQLILCESKMANAFTLPSRAEVVVTTGLLKKLDMRETTAILGHELGHATSDHTTPRVLAKLLLVIPATFAGVYFAVKGGFKRLFAGKAATEADMASRLWQSSSSTNFIAAHGPYVYGAIGANIGSIVANQLTVRPTELDADRKGAVISGDPEGLISALTKLESSFDKKPIMRAIAYIVSGYPTTGYRIRKLREMPQQMHFQSAEPMVQAPHSAMAVEPAQAPSLNISAAELGDRIVDSIGINRALS